MINYYKVNGDVTVIFIERKSGEVIKTLIDTDNLIKVLPFKSISVNKSSNHNHYVAVRGENRKTIFLHRFLLNVSPEYVVDHINHNTLDNRLCNLRIVTQAQNLQNRKGAQSNSKTGIRGVYYDDNPQRRNKWRSHCRLNGKGKILGSYATQDEAIKAVTDFRKQYMPYSTN